MPVQPPVSYPGVYIQEVESNVRTIVPVPTANTAFVGRARRGPVNEPVICHNFGDFQRVFGGLWDKSQLGYAVNDFFNNGGATAIVVRVFAKSSDDKTAATGQVATAQTKAAAALTAAQTANKVSDLKKAAGDAQAAAGKSANDAKAAAEKAAEDAKAADDAQKAADSATGAAKADADKAAAAAKTAAEKSAADAKAAADKATNDKATADKAAANAQTAADRAATDPSVVAANKAVDDAKAAINEPVLALLPLDPDGLSLEALEPGAWSKGLKAEVTKVPADDVSKELAKRLGDQFSEEAQDETNKASYLKNVFNLRVYENIEGGASESYSMLTVGDTPRRVDRVLAQQSRLVRLQGDAPAGTATVPPAKVGNDGKPAPIDVSNPDALNDGADLMPADLLGQMADRSGMYALETVAFNMLIFPQYQFNSSGDPDSTLFGEAAKYCADRRAMLLLDSPQGLWSGIEDAKAGLKKYINAAGAYGQNAAFFFPRLKKANPLRDGQIEDFSPLGSVAGVMARTDATRGVWKAAAGLDAVIGGVVGLTTTMTDAQNGELNPLGINCLRSMPSGNVIWGARTLKGDDRLANQWKYVPVRRTALLIEESLYQGTQWAVFEPNDEPLWSQLRLNIGSFMHELFRQGAFQGGSPKDAYFVECGPNTTTQADIDKGIVNIYVGFAPLKPAEFVVLYIQQKAGTPAV